MIEFSSAFLDTAFFIYHLENHPQFAKKTSTQIADNAAKLRAKYAFLKGMDALQFGVAQSLACDTFITNDFKLSRVSEFKIILISDIIL